MRDLIRRDQSSAADEERWLKDLDASLNESIREMEAGGGVDLDRVSDAIVADVRGGLDPAHR
ncbi:hypothetical protein [Sphingobium sp. Leaf26]|uniref:hypothetical protein n=1 Tax=Sphingobium sp. Leaf26 TaxID=1735693 RepID=UPI001F2549F4|nr:hypothetical protein [Sphingobium sp. Leaf26]